MLNFLFPILDNINDGRFVRHIVVNCLRVFAVIHALAGLVAVIAVLKLAFNAAAPASVSMAGLFLAALFVAAAACMMQILLYRATHIAQFSQGDYIFIGIASQLQRMLGELLATFFVTLGLAAFLVAIVAGSAGGGLEEVLPGPFGRMATSGFGGFGALLLALTFAFAFLMAGYLAGEFLQFVTDVAGDVRRIAFAPAASPLSAFNARICTKCGCAVAPGNAFCTECGFPIAKVVNA